MAQSDTLALLMGLIVGPFVAAFVVIDVMVGWTLWRRDRKGRRATTMSDDLEILREHQERTERLDRIEHERARQEATQPRGACLHVFLRHGDGDECVCVKCSLHMTDAEAQHYLESLAPSDKQKSLLERLQDANEAE